MPPRADRAARPLLVGLAIVLVLALAVGVEPAARAQLETRRARAIGDVAQAQSAGTPTRPPGAPSRHHIPLSGGTTHLIVDGTLNDVLTGPMLIDTGSSYCVLTRKTAARLGLAEALLTHASTYGILPSHLVAVIDGCQVDLEQTRFLDFAGLARYCHLVAGVVGEVAANIFGRTSDQTVEYAHRLGLAMQLTNIIRDVGDDARRGRIYLPVSELQQFDVKAQEILDRTAPYGYSERFTALMKFQAARAHRCYDEALALLPEADREPQKPGLMMANIYRTLLREIEADGFRVLHQRTSLTPLRKLWIAMRTNWRGR